MKQEEHELAEAFDAYIDPEHPLFRREFALEFLQLRPDWFSHEELVKLVLHFATMDKNPAWLLAEST